MASALVIPLKKSATVDFSAPLKRYLLSEFGAEEAAKYEKDLAALQHLRSVAAAAETATAANRHALDVYYAQVTRLTHLFPISERDINVAFRWSDAFAPNRKSTQSSLAFERASLLYNMAAMESKAGSEADWNTDDGIKQAAAHFQHSAWLFNYVKDELTPELIGTLTSDLTPSGLTMAATLMLAQAQSCTFQKAVRDKKKTGGGLAPAMIAKVAMQASDFYKQALELALSPNLAPHIAAHFTGKMQYHQHLYAAQAQYWQAQDSLATAEQTGVGYGPAIARLTLCLDDCAHKARGLSKMHNLGDGFTSTLTALVTAATKEKTVLVKDNQTVYIEPVPNTAQLPNIDKLQVAKPKELPEDPGKLKSAPLFEGLLPRAAAAALESYKSAAGPIVASTLEHAKSAREDTRVRLAKVGLPGSVDAQQSSDDGISDAVWRKVEGTQGFAGGVSVLREKASELEYSAKRASSILDTVEQTLQQEENRDDQFRKRYAGQYEGETSATLAVDLKKDVAHYRKLWQTARSKDAEITARLDQPQTRSALQLIDQSRAAIDAHLKASTQSSSGRGHHNPFSHSSGSSSSGAAAASSHDSQRQQALAPLSAGLQELATITAEREALCAALAEEGKGETVRGQILSTAPAQAEAVVAAALQQLQEKAKKITQDCDDSECKVLGRVLELNEAFQEMRSQDAASRARESLMEQLNAGVEAYHSAHSQLSEGIMFYADLLRRLAQLAQTAEDMVYTRGLQRREFELQYTHRRQAAEQQAQDEAMALKLAGDLNVSHGGASSSASSSSHYQQQQQQQQQQHSQQQHHHPAVPARHTAQPALDPRLARLMEMGFEQRKAEEALRKCKGDEQAAVAQLLSQP